MLQPGAATAVGEAVVHPALAALPELDGLGHDAEAAPVRRQRHGAVGEAGLRLGVPLLEGLARRRPRCDCGEAQAPELGGPRAGGEVGRRSPPRTPSRRHPRPGPGAAGRATGTAARSPGRPRARRPCASRSWCRRRSLARRPPSAAPSATTGGRGWRPWRPPSRSARTGRRRPRRRSSDETSRSGPAARSGRSRPASPYSRRSAASVSGSGSREPGAAMGINLVPLGDG